MHFELFKKFTNGFIEIVYHVNKSTNYLEDEWRKLLTLLEYLKANLDCEIVGSDDVVC